MSQEIFNELEKVANANKALLLLAKDILNQPQSAINLAVVESLFYIHDNMKNIPLTVTKLLNKQISKENEKLKSLLTMVKSI